MRENIHKIFVFLKFLYYLSGEVAMKQHYSRYYYSGIAAALFALAMFWICASAATASEIHDAVGLSNIAKIEELLKANPECVNEYNDRGQTPLLMWINPSRNLDVIKLLLEHKADPNAPMKDFSKETPMHMACQWGLSDVVELLLEKGANPRCRDHDGATPIFFAAGGNHAQIVKRLLGLGINVNDIEHDKTIVHLAAKYGAIDVLRMLLDMKADPNIHDVDNSTPLHYAAGWLWGGPNFFGQN